MGLYHDETGRLIDVDDDFADARGYAPADPSALGGVISQKAAEARANERGVVGSVNAAATGALSSLTLGGSDYLLGQVLDPLERERVLAEIDAHPYLHAGGEIAGIAVGALAGPGSIAARTPAGYLGATTGQFVERGLEQGGAAGIAKAVGAMGAEGAIQSAGQYIGHTALEDKEVTAEGLAGALGTGFEFGVVGGGAALGVVKGTVAARRMYSRVMDGRKAAQAAESSWSQASQEALEAAGADARLAETKLDNIRTAKTAAQRDRNTAGALTREERIRASGGETRPVEPDFEASVPTDVVPREKAPGGMPTSVFKRPGELEGPVPLDVGVPDAAGGQATSVFQAKRPSDFATGPKTARMARPAEVTTDLEARIAGTKAKLDDGTRLKDVRRELDEGGLAARPSDEDAIRSKIYEMKRQGRTKESMLADLKAGREEALSEIRYKKTEELLGAQIAKQEQALQEAVDEFKAAKSEFENLAVAPAIDPVGGFKRVGPQDATQNISGGRRQALEILDNAHEEALLRAKHAADPQEAGQAVTEAQNLEDLLEGLSVDLSPEAKGLSRAQLRTAGGQKLADDMLREIDVVKRYEKASARLADELGGEAHPVSTMQAKGLRDAERESERTMYERAARAVDDHETFGPTYASPKERVRYARERQNDAQVKLDELGVQEKEALLAHQDAKRKVRAGEKDKKLALRADAQAARATAAVGKASGKAQDLGGILEMIDIPGLPKPSDLPIVGPLLGAYLKMRTMKKALSGVMGRVPATADARVATLASQTRDRIARAVDRSLGTIEKSGKKALRIVPPAAGILASHIYDDGREDPPKNASITKLAAARMREVQAFISTPGAIEMSVRRELRGVTNPDVIAAAEKMRRSMMEYVARVMPKVPEQGLLNHTQWEPSPGQAMSFARTMDALGDPAGVYERLADKRALLSLEAADVMQNVYPRLWQQAQQRVLENAAERKAQVPYRTRVQMAILYKLPALEPGLDPVNFQITQSVFERKPASPAYNPTAPGAAPAQAPTAQPAIANPVNISEAFTPAIDRR